MKRDFLQEVLEARDVDQEIRRRAKGKGKGIFNILYYVVDRLHNYVVKEWITKYGYPTRKKIGEEGMSAFWILIMHQFLDSKLQESCLRNCDFTPEEKAKLTDRILALRGKKQKYGTFMKIENDKYVLHPVKDMKDAEKMRKKIGLSPIKECLATLNTEKGKKKRG